MWRSKKLTIAAVLATVLVGGSIGGVVLAQTGSGSPAGVLLTQNVGENVSQPKTLLARVATILGIDQQTVEDAFAQAQRDMQTDALRNRLQRLVSEGKITQAQADQYLAWWQAKPDMAPFQQQLKEWQQARPAMPSELKEWQQARPDVPLPGPFRGHRGIRGMGGRYGMPGFGGMSVPAQ